MSDDGDFEKGEQIGNLNGQILTLFKQNKAHGEKLDKILDNMNTINLRAVRAHDRLDHLIGPKGPITLTGEDGVITSLKDGMKDYQKTKLKGMAALGAIALSAGAAGNKAMEKIIAILGF